MTKSYHIDIAVFVAYADRRWVDNFLTRVTIAGVTSGRRGVARRLSAAAIHQIALARWLSQELGLPIDAAAHWAGRLLRSETGSIALSAHLELRLELQAFRHEVELRIAEATESVVPAARGRRKTIRTTRSEYSGTN